MRPEFFFSDYFRNSESDQAQAFRNNALKQVTKHEWPKFRKSEFWKYTNPDALFKGLEKKSDEQMLIDIEPYMIEGAINILDTKDGLFIKDELPMGVHLSNILDTPEVLNDEETSHQLYFLKEMKNLLLLNYSYLNGGFSLDIDKNTLVEKPIHIIHTKGNEHVFRKNRIQVGKFSKATLIETYVSDNELNLFFNLDTHIQVEESAHFSHYKLELSEAHDRVFNNVNVNIHKHAFYNNLYYTNGGYKIKNNITANLSEEGAETSLNGLYLLKNKNHVDNSSKINHMVAHTRSTQLYKGLLNDQSEAVFDGIVEIYKDAKLSDSNQLNQNMLLSEKATANSMPQLIIGNDDVKCSHGSTSGQMDRNQLFYLQSRGMSEEEGRKLLAKAFIHEVLSEINHDNTRNLLLDVVNKTFWS